MAGIPCLRSLDDLPSAPDAAFLGINRHAAIEATATLSAMGCGGAVCFASGFAETGDDGPAGGACRGGRADAASGAELLWRAELSGRRDAVAGPAWRLPGRTRRRHHQPVVEHRDQYQHAGARPADRLHGLRRQPGADKPHRHGAKPSCRRPGERRRALCRGHHRSGRLRRDGGRGGGARQIHRRHQVRQDGRLADGGKLAHGGAGRRCGGLLGLSCALRGHRGRRAGGDAGDAEASPPFRTACPATGSPRCAVPAAKPG